MLKERLNEQSLTSTREIHRFARGLVAPALRLQGGKIGTSDDWKAIEGEEASKDLGPVEYAPLKEKIKAPTLVLPTALQSIFKKDAKLQKAFNALTPGRQRAYLIYFSSAKNEQTIINRIEKYAPKILCGKGFNDCTCGLSKRMPTCDGSHKFAFT